jgi:hypothetical protein
VTLAAPADEHRKLVEQAGRAWNEGRYADAIKALEAARAIKPSGRVIFNLARAYEKHGDLELAIKTYEAYLEAPDAEPAVMKRTRTLLGALYKSGARAEAPPPVVEKPPAAEPEKPPDPVATDAPTKQPEPVLTPREPVVVLPVAPAAPPSRPLRVTGVVLVAVGLAAVGAGIGVGAWAQGTATSAHASTDPLQKPQLVADAQGRATAADVTWASGAGVATLGGVLVLIDALRAP